MRPWHKVLIIEEWTEMGAFVSDLLRPSSASFHISLSTIEEAFYPLLYTSPEGEDEDLEFLIHSSLIDSFKD